MLRWIFLIFINCIFLTRVYSNDKFQENPNVFRLQTLAKIISNCEKIVIDFQNDHLYLDPNKIAITDHGILLHLENSEKVILSEIYFDQNGYYILCTSEDLNRLSQQTDELRIWWCEVCRRFRSMDKWGYCQVCGRKL